jgi:predicted nuclease of predicted toxin-antitoxin system
MKLLLDTCVWGGARSVLEEVGHDVVWVGDWPEDPGDLEILTRAAAAGRILVTLDKDFGELAIVRGAAHSGIVRLAGLPARDQGSVCIRVLARHGEELSAGAIVTVMQGRVRIRPAE